MNPGGPAEEVGATARGIVDALKAQPAVLALSLANLALLVFIFYALYSAATFREQMLNRVLPQAEAIRELLTRCAVPPPTL